MEMQRIFKPDRHVLSIQVNTVTFSQPANIQKQDFLRKKIQTAAEPIPESRPSARTGFQGALQATQGCQEKGTSAALPQSV